MFIKADLSIFTSLKNFSRKNNYHQGTDIYTTLQIIFKGFDRKKVFQVKLWKIFVNKSIGTSMTKQAK